MTRPVRGEPERIQTEDGRSRFEGKTLWLTQAQIAELFQTTPQNITLHLKLVAERALDEAAACKPYLQVRRKGPRDVERSRNASP